MSASLAGPTVVLSPDQLKEVANRILAISEHIQNKELYDVSWANAAARPGFGSSSKQAGLVASRDVSKGELLSLFPVHAIGLQGLGSSEGTDYIIFDNKRDGGYFRQKKRSPHQVGVDERWLVDLNPDLAVVTGWMAHLAQMVPASSSINCCLFPIAPPAICGLVAICNIREGDRLCRPTVNTKMEVSESIQEILSERYRDRIAELQTFMSMAFPSELIKEQTARQQQEIKEEDATVFHSINLDYSGLSFLHWDPNIISVQNFLTDDECRRLIEKARPHLMPCVTKDPQTGEVLLNTDRTSTNANIPQNEIPSIVEKLTKLCSCQKDQLEIVQILRYEEDQKFLPHTDGFSGPTTACGFESSGRLVTIFCYLNTVSEGGTTRFTKLGLDIKPRQGTAVLHFPTSLELEQDFRTEHEGSKALDEKWLLVTWVWQHPRTDTLYGENKLPKLSEDII